MAWLAANGITRLVEVGAGKVLSGLAKRTAPEATAHAVGTPDEAKALAAALKA
jgi:[acyl-carrier-protein] S-malonyltransferase